MFGLLGKSKKSARFVGAVRVGGENAHVILASVKGNELPHVVSEEEIKVVSVDSRTAEWDQEYRRSGFTVDWIALASAFRSQTTTVLLDPEDLAKDPDTRVRTALWKAGFSEALIKERNLRVRTELRGERCVILAVSADEIDRIAELVPTERLWIDTPAHAFMANVEKSHPEVLAKDSPLSLFVCAAGDGFSMLSYGRGKCLLVHQVDLVSIGAGAEASPHEPRVKDPSVILANPDLYARLLEAAVGLAIKLLRDFGEQPSTIATIYLTGECVDEFDLLSALKESYGHRINILPVAAQKPLVYTAAAEEQKRRAKVLFDRRATYALSFGLVVSGTSTDPLVPVHLDEPMPAPTEATRSAKPSLLSAKTASLAGALALTAAVGCGAPYFYVSSQIAEAEHSIRYEIEQEAIYKKYADERAELEAKKQHQEELVKRIDAERASQYVPVGPLDDVWRAYSQVPGNTDPTDIGRITLSTLAWDGNAVTITGRCYLLDNITAFGRTLGALDDRQRFSEVDTTHHEVKESPSEDYPDGRLVYQFTIRSPYKPAPPAAK